MLSMDERQALAGQLEKLHTDLEAYEDGLIQSLPSELKKRVHSQVILGTMTSSGLEHVSSILNRINWAIYYLTDPDFTRRYEAKQRTRQQQAFASAIQATPSPTPSAQYSTPASKLEEPESQINLDFGPFDPRQGQQS